MPTLRPRHTITETETIARALKDAALRWPDDAARPQRLLVHLIDEGHKAVRAASQDGAGRRSQAVRDTAGLLTGSYGVGYLRELRGEWPD